MTSAANAWLTRAGNIGEYEQLALDNDLEVIGWADCRTCPELTREQIPERIREQHLDAGKLKINNWTGQLITFVRGIQLWRSRCAAAQEPAHGASRLPPIEILVDILDMV